MTHGDNAHDDPEYVEEHVFEIENDAPKTYNQRHAKVINQSRIQDFFHLGKTYYFKFHQGHT